MTPGQKYKKYTPDPPPAVKADEDPDKDVMFATYAKEPYTALDKNDVVVGCDGDYMLVHGLYSFCVPCKQMHAYCQDGKMQYCDVGYNISADQSACVPFTCPEDKFPDAMGQCKPCSNINGAECDGTAITSCYEGQGYKPKYDSCEECPLTENGTMANCNGTHVLSCPEFHWMNSSTDQKGTFYQCITCAENYTCDGLVETPCIEGGNCTGGAFHGCLADLVITDGVCKQKVIPCNTVCIAGIVIALVVVIVIVVVVIYFVK